MTMREWGKEVTDLEEVKGVLGEKSLSLSSRKETKESRLDSLYYPPPPSLTLFSLPILKQTFPRFPSSNPL